MRIHSFPKGTSPKVNIIARLQFDLTYKGVKVQCVSHYTTETPASIKPLVYPNLLASLSALLSSAAFLCHCLVYPTPLSVGLRSKSLFLRYISNMKAQEGALHQNVNDFMTKNKSSSHFRCQKYIYIKER